MVSPPSPATVLFVPSGRLWDGSVGGRAGPWWEGLGSLAPDLRLACCWQDKSPGRDGLCP